jgi:hypothetical protein
LSIVYAATKKKPSQHATSHPNTLNTTTMSTAPAHSDKTSTTARMAITSGPAAATAELRKNKSKYKKFREYATTATESSLREPSQSNRRRKRNSP